MKYRLGVDYETLKGINPAIVYASISGFGQDGPDSERPGVDQIIQGMSGLMSITGEPEQGPMRVGIAISDTSAGMFWDKAFCSRYFTESAQEKANGCTPPCLNP